MLLTCEDGHGRTALSICERKARWPDAAAIVLGIYHCLQAIDRRSGQPGKVQLKDTPAGLISTVNIVLCAGSLGLAGVLFGLLIPQKIQCTLQRDRKTVR